MAAYKVSSEDMQRDLSVAQQCKCENRCIDYLKLQSELNEVRLELKSVKEILKILNRGLASIDLRVHNLYDTRIASYCNTNIWKLAFKTFYKEELLRSDSI